MVAGGEVTLQGSVTLDESLNSTKDLTVNLNGKTVKCDKSDVFVVTAGHLILDGEGEVLASTDNSNSACAVWAKENGNVTIKGGTYKVGDDETGKPDNWRNDCIYARDNATITIEGGTFQYTGENPLGHKFLLNVRDADKTTAEIVVKGGKFFNFNPAATASENPIANFVAVGYKVINLTTNEVATDVHSGNDTWYEVVPE